MLFFNNFWVINEESKVIRKDSVIYLAFTSFLLFSLLCIVFLIFILRITFGVQLFVYIRIYQNTIPSFWVSLVLRFLFMTFLYHHHYIKRISSVLVLWRRWLIEPKVLSCQLAEPAIRFPFPLFTSNWP